MPLVLRAPSPHWGEGWGEGLGSIGSIDRPEPPHPNLLPSGEKEPAALAAPSVLISSEQVLRRRPLQLRLQRTALFGCVDHRVVIGERPRARDAQRGEHRTVLSENVRDLLLEGGQLREVVAGGVAG